MDSSAFIALALACAPDVDTATTRALVAVESGFNPHAIGVVGGALLRQPRNRAEAIATARSLQAAGWNFSLGLTQINVHNLKRLGLDVERAFDPCASLTAMQTVLAECFVRAEAGKPAAHPRRQHVLRQALSCYYSGNFSTGFDHGYVRRVATASARPAPIPVTASPQEAP